MTTGSIVAFHTMIIDLHHLMSCVLQSGIDILYIIDHSLSDSLRELRAMSERIVHVYSDNLGYSNGHNIAIRKSIEESADYHIVLNPDIYQNEDVIKGLARFVESHADCDLVMPEVLYPGGSIQYLCRLLPTPMDLFGRRFIPLRSYQMKCNTHFELHDSEYNQAIEVPSSSGCFVFMRVDVLKRVGGLDEHFFVYAEDLDLCRRVGEVSKTMYYPVVSIYHEYGKDSYKNKKLLKHRICSAIKYFNKWGWIFNKKRTLRNKECLEKLNLVSK